MVVHMCKDALNSVSAGKFELLADWEETSLLRAAGTLQSEIEIKHLTDVDAARELIRNILRAKCWDRRRTLHIMLAVSEGVTNVLKHAHSGKMEIRSIGNGIRLIVADQGPGLNLLKLPHMILRRGYSTKNSLGYGFNIMYKVSDKFYIASSEKGTFLALDFLNYGSL